MNAILLAAALGLLSPELDALVEKVGAREKAAETEFENRGVTMAIEAKELDKKGAPTSTKEIVFHRTFRDGQEHEELVRYAEDGKDLTEQKREERRKRDAEKAAKKEPEQEKGDDAELRTPFHPDVVASYSFEDKGADATDPSLRRIAFKPKPGAKGGELLVGEAVVTADARVARMKATLAKLPMLVSRVDMSFEYGTDGGLRAMEVAGEGGALFIKKRFAMKSTFTWDALP